jgi:hypothetical protein
MTCAPPKYSCCLLACVLLACTSRLPGTEDETEDETGDGPSDTSEDSCMSGSAVQFTAMDDSEANDEFVTNSPCIVTAAEHDPNDPARWTFVLDCQAEVAVELRTDPPLDELPFEVGEELSGHIADGDPSTGFQMVELQDPQGRVRMALFDTRGPANSMVDQPTFANSPFEFEWSPADDCTTTDAECGVLNQLRIDASAGGESLSLEPEQRYGVLAGAAPNESYGLWIGDSWISDCGGQAKKALRYAVVALP